MNGKFHTPASEPSQYMQTAFVIFPYWIHEDCFAHSLKLQAQSTLSMKSISFVV
ncbi:hypothetical protein [Bacillus amyloliquefaciens]|uniref:hypothetical protein n=1 Tax=Bacillus amyloliquefaciens TaxID=1390 RepID=UPI003A89F9F1